jgi:hypothetical protein
LCLLLLAPVLLSCQVRAREEELLNLTSLHTATKASADKRIAALESRVTKLLEANRWEQLGDYALPMSCSEVGVKGWSLRFQPGEDCHDCCDLCSTAWRTAPWP